MKIKKWLFWTIVAVLLALTLPPLELYKLRRAEEAQTAHGGKPVQAISTRARYNEHRESKYIY